MLNVLVPALLTPNKQASTSIMHLTLFLRNVCDSACTFSTQVDALYLGCPTSSKELLVNVIICVCIMLWSHAVWWKGGNLCIGKVCSSGMDECTF